MTDEKIIKSIKNGDETAIHFVITKYSRLLWSVVGSVLKNVASEQDMEECVADVFIYLWQHPEKYDVKRGSLKVWLSVIARTKAIDRYRELTRQNLLPLQDSLFLEQLDVIDGILARNERQTLFAAVTSLEEPDREILVRRYYYNQKPKEIAVALSLPKKYVENRIYRTKQKLREMIANEKGGSL